MATRENYSSGSVLIAMIEETSATMRQEDVTAKENDYARTWFSEYAAIHRKGGKRNERGRYTGITGVVS